MKLHVLGHLLENVKRLHDMLVHDVLVYAYFYIHIKAEN